MPATRSKSSGPAIRKLRKSKTVTRQSQTQLQIRRKLPLNSDLFAPTRPVNTVPLRNQVIPPVTTGTEDANSIDLADVHPIEPVTDSMADVQMASFYGNPGDRGDLWLTEYEDYCACKGFTEERRTSSFRFFLKDHAKQWYLSLPEAELRDFDLLMTKFKDRFNGSDGAVSIGSIKQTPGESCSAYFTRFLAATNQREYPTDLLVQFSIEGLVDPVKHLLLMQNLTDLDSVRLAALRAERAVTQQAVSVAAVHSSNVDIDKLTERMDLLSDLVMKQLQGSQVL